MSNVIIYGFHAVNACLLKQLERIEFLVADSHRNDERMSELLRVAKQRGVEVRMQTRNDLNILSDTTHHQGIVAVIKSLEQYKNLEDYLDNIALPFLLILDGIQDPHNLGACLRTANAAGVHAVIAPRDRACGMTSVVSKVASGATLFTPFFQVTNLARTLEMLKERGIWLYGTSEHAKTLYTEVDYSEALGIVMGSEGKGLRKLTEKNCDYLIQIPMLGSVPSLNVSVATGICIFEVVRQLMKKAPY